MLKVGEKIELNKGKFDVVGCEKCDHPMVNIDRDDIGVGDMVKMKLHGVRLSNPYTKKAVCLDCEVENDHEPVRKAREWFHSDSNDDTPFFGGFGGRSSDSGSSSGGGFDFGGFSGGGFSGGGASGGF